MFFDFEKLAMFSDLEILKEEKSKLEKELYSFQWSIKGRPATHEELKKEAQYRKDISMCANKINQKDLEIKRTLKIRAIIFVIGFTIIITSLAFFKNCSIKEKNVNVNLDYSSSISEKKLLSLKKNYIN